MINSDKNYTVGDLIEHLKQFNLQLHVVVYHNSKDHHYSINKEQIKLIKNGYFGNDSFATEKTWNSSELVQIGEI